MMLQGCKYPVVLNGLTVRCFGEAFGTGQQIAVWRRRWCERVGKGKTGNGCQRPVLVIVQLIIKMCSVEVIKIVNVETSVFGQWYIDKLGSVVLRFDDDINGFSGKLVGRQAVHFSFYRN